MEIKYSLIITKLCPKISSLIKECKSIQAYVLLIFLVAKHVACEGENAFGIAWKETKPDNFAARSCPREAKGKHSKKQNKELNEESWFNQIIK